MSDTTEVTQCKIYFDGREVLPFTQESKTIEIIGNMHETENKKEILEDW